MSEVGPVLLVPFDQLPEGKGALGLAEHVSACVRGTGRFSEPPPPSRPLEVSMKCHEEDNQHLLI